jgi:CheY-like chemotaxis protein
VLSQPREGSTVQPFALVIEDNKDHALIFAEALRAADYETEMVYDGETALARLAATAPALVVLDLRIPRVPGREILRYIRAENRLAETRVILATGDHITAERLHNEAEVVLIKPIDFIQLRDLAVRMRPPESAD